MYRKLIALFVICGGLFLTSLASTTNQSLAKSPIIKKEKPMFFAKLAEIDSTSPLLAKYPESVRKAIVWLKKNDLSKLPIGKTEIEGNRIFVNVSEYTPVPFEKAKAEAHRKYIDIQLILEGEEMLGSIPMTNKQPVVQEYNAETDLLFVDKSVMSFLATSQKSPHQVILHKGEMTIFTPQDLHAPGLISKEGVKVKKLVAKCIVE